MTFHWLNGASCDLSAESRFVFVKFGNLENDFEASSENACAELHTDGVIGIRTGFSIARMHVKR
jgi:hypothetical protein